MSRCSQLRAFRNRAALALVIVVSLTLTVLRAQDPLKTLPNNYRSIFDNTELTVIRAHYGPHEKVPVHDHVGVATVFVYLNDSSPVRIDHDGDKAFSVVRPPTVMGSFRVVAGMAERHSIENLGNKSSDFLRIELKQVSFPEGEAFRGSAPKNLEQNLDAVEFNEAGVQIERIICTSGPGCAIKPVQSPSLIVAITPLGLAAGSGQQRKSMEAGAVRWLTPSQATTVFSDSGAAVHLLRVILSPKAVAS